MTGRTGGSAPSGSQRHEPDHAPAASTVASARCSAPSSVDDAADRVAVVDGAGDRSAGDDLGALALARRAERRHDRDRVHPGLVRRVHSGESRRAQPRLELAALAPGQPLRLEAERAHQVEAPAELSRLVGVERDVKRAVPKKRRLRPAGVGELRRELRPHAMRGQRGVEQRPPRPRSPRRPEPASPPRRPRRPIPAPSARSRARASPLWAARHAHARPMTPAPTITTSRRS